MGYAMRTERYRLVVWVARDDHTKIDAIELYDHANDPQENQNIAQRPENAALVEMSASASNTLVDRAQALREAVVSMRLRQASADEAHDLAVRALAHIEQSGRETAIADFHDPSGDFIDRDLYVFIFDRNGNISAFGSKPALVGGPASAVPGLEANSFLEQAWAAADAGGGWIQYDVISPGTKAVTPKESYILPLGTGEFIGCGAYRRITDVDYPNACEMKRLYVRKGFRGLGLGRLLAEAALDAARQADYACVLLDTLDDMEAARALYGELGFAEIPPYYHNPIAGAHYLRAVL